jgi:hypothetical protein
MLKVSTTASLITHYDDDERMLTEGPQHRLMRYKSSVERWYRMHILSSLSSSPFIIDQTLKYSTSSTSYFVLSNSRKKIVLF